MMKVHYKERVQSNGIAPQTTNEVNTVNSKANTKSWKHGTKTCWLQKFGSRKIKELNNTHNHNRLLVQLEHSALSFN